MSPADGLSSLRDRLGPRLKRVPVLRELWYLGSAVLHRLLLASERCVRRVWGELFEVVAYLPAAVNRLQDAVVLRRPA